MRSEKLANMITVVDGLKLLSKTSGGPDEQLLRVVREHLEIVGDIYRKMYMHKKQTVEEVYESPTQVNAPRYPI